MATYLELHDGRDDGARLGKASTDLVAFWGGTPIAQKSGTSQATLAGISATVATAGVTTLTLSSIANSLAVEMSSLRTLTNELRNCLVSYGIIAGA